MIIMDSGVSKKNVLYVVNGRHGLRHYCAAIVDLGAIAKIAVFVGSGLRVIQRWSATIIKANVQSVTAMYKGYFAKQSYEVRFSANANIKWIN